jgi:hypothetical protein
MEQFELYEGDCDDMVRLFATRPVSVKKIEGRYFLQVPELKLPVGNTQVPDAAQEILSLLNGIARLDLGNFRPPKILGFSNTNPHTGKLQTFMSLGGKCEGRIRCHGTLTVRLSDGTIATNQAPAYVETVSKLADDNKSLNLALTLFGKKKQHDWISLYNVFDAIQESCGGRKLIEQQWVTEDEIDDFKHNANQHRHALTECKPRKRKSKQPVRQKKAMTLAEGEAWISGILRAWVKKLIYIGEKRAVAPPPVRGSFVRDDAQEYCFAITGLFPTKSI